ncbi:cache domain containing protein [Schistosoma japonicum]|nr:cache domain containing protein [Schistosoma japonicum]
MNVNFSYFHHCVGNSRNTLLSVAFPAQYSLPYYDSEGEDLAVTISQAFVDQISMKNTHTVLCLTLASYRYLFHKWIHIDYILLIVMPCFGTVYLSQRAIARPFNRLIQRYGENFNNLHHLVTYLFDYNVSISNPGLSATTSPSIRSFVAIVERIEKFWIL